MRRWSQVVRRSTPAATRSSASAPRLMLREGFSSLADVALLLHKSITPISQDIVAYEHDSGQTVPRRGTVDDMGRSVTHKAIICSPAAGGAKAHQPGRTRDVSQRRRSRIRCLQCFRRVQLCWDSGMLKEDIAQATGHSFSCIVGSILDLIDEFKLLPLPEPWPGRQCMNQSHRNMYIMPI